MLCLSGCELFSRWVPLINAVGESSMTRMELKSFLNTYSTIILLLLFPRLLKKLTEATECQNQTFVLISCMI